MPSLIAILGFDKGPFDKGIDAAQAKARSGGKGIESAFGGLGKYLAGFASVGAVGAAIHSTVEYGSKINDLSLRLGISTDAVQQWDYALGQNGSTIESAVGFFEKLGVNRQKALDGNEDAIASFAKLGVTLDDLKTKRLEDVGATIAKAFTTGDPQQLISALREVGGKGAGELVAAFRSDFAQTLGEAPLISGEDIEAIDRMGDAWSRLKAQGMALMGTALPAIGDFIMQGIDVARIGLDFAVGAFTGAYDALSKLRPVDFLNPLSALSSASKVFDGAVEGAGSAAEKAVDRAGSNQSKRERDAAAAHEAYLKKKAALEAMGAGDDEEKQSKKEIALADKAAKESERLAAKEQAADAKAQADALKETEKAQKEGAAFGKHSVNAQQQLGAFFGNYDSAGAATAPELAALNVQMQSERHLAQIVKLLSGSADSNQTAF